MINGVNTSELNFEPILSARGIWKPNMLRKAG